MEINEAVNSLRSLVGEKEWFYDISPLRTNSIVVYTLWQSHDILSEIPEDIGGYQVLVHFAPTAKPKQEYPKHTLTPYVAQESVPPTELKLDVLIKELDRLEKICGSRTLQDIFYEIQDGKNAVTDMSKRYPEVRKPLEQLFDTYGFDVIYEEIDG